MNPPPEVTSSDLLRVHDRIDALRGQIDAHEKSDLIVHGKFETFMASADYKLDELLKNASKNAETGIWIVRLIVGALAMAVISFALKGGFNIQ